MKFVFFGSSTFSKYVLDELRAKNLEPILNITSARDPLPKNKLREAEADVFIVASFGKILPDEIIYMPPLKTLNVHPSLLPALRGPSPIQYSILGENKAGVTIMRMDEKMDHGPIIAQKEIPLSPWPDRYSIVEEKLARAGGKLLGEILPLWIKGGMKETNQDENRATYTKLIRKEDGEINLDASPEENLRKIYAYEIWPKAYFVHKRTDGKKIRVTITEAEIENHELKILSVIPEGKKEMSWQSFLRGNS